MWWDNFDRNIDTEAGGGSIHNTPGVVFQEKSPSAKLSEQNISITNSKRRSIILENDEPLPATRINPKTNPGIFQSCSGADQNDGVFTLIDNILVAWKIFRHTNKDKSIWPRFSGLVALLFKKESSERTVLTYLPPIPKPISEYSTIIEIFYQSRQLAKQCNMQYVHIVMDVGAAMNHTKLYGTIR